MMSSDNPAHISPNLQRIRDVIWRRKLPDYVPVEIGIGPWYACKLLGATTLDVARGSPTPQECMDEAFRRYKYDPWLWASNSVWMTSQWADEGPQPETTEEIICDTKSEYAVRAQTATPFGALTTTTRTIAGQPTAQTEFPIKVIERDWPAYRYCAGENRAYPDRLCIDHNMIGRGAGGPGACLPVSWWHSIRHGGIGAVAADLLERPDLMSEIFEWYTRRCLEELDAIALAKNRDLIDAYFIQGSASSLSLSSMQFFRAYDLPFLKLITAQTRNAGIASHLHVCGRSLGIVQLCHEHTDLDIIEPLEPPPGGDCDLAEIKRRYGDRFVLKGNINTFDLLARRSPREVREAVKRSLDAAMEGGGFWLATGDQTPADAPDENLIAMVETAREYGQY